MTSVAVPGNRRRAASRRAAQSRRGAGELRQEPWARRDVVVLAVVCAIAVTGLIVTWIGISGAVSLTRQSRWLGVGIGSLLLGGLAMVGWLVLGMARVGVLRAAIVRELALAEADDAASAPAAGYRRFGAVPGMRHYHYDDCRLLTDKTPSWGTVATHAEVGLLPCGICRPPGPEARS